MTDSEKLKHCKGCRDDYYNHGNNSTTGRCWMLPSMKLVSKKRVPMDQPPPWTQKPVQVPDCKHERGYVFVGKDQLR